MCHPRSMPNYTPEVLVSLYLVHINLVHSCGGTVISWLELVIHVVKGWPREPGKLHLCTPHDQKGIDSDWSHPELI